LQAAGRFAIAAIILPIFSILPTLAKRNLIRFRAENKEGK
jgi:hypothetical protein